MGVGEAEGGSFAARVVILPLEGKLLMFIRGRNSLPLCLCIIRSKEMFLYVCVPKMEEQVSRNCTNALLNCCIWFGVSSEVQILRTNQAGE